MARNLIFSVCLGLLVLVSVTVANRFQPAARGKANSRQTFVRWIRPRPQPVVGGRGGRPGVSSSRLINTNKGHVTLYKGRSILSSQQIEAFFQRNPAARQKSQSIQARAAAFARRNADPAACSCAQETCVEDAKTFDRYTKETGDICVVTNPRSGYDFVQCTGQSMNAACPEVLACGLGSCQDVDLLELPVAAICIVDLTPGSVDYYFEDIAVVLPNGCCCTQE